MKRVETTIANYLGKPGLEGKCAELEYAGFAPGDRVVVVAKEDVFDGIDMIAEYDRGIAIGEARAAEAIAALISRKLLLEPYAVKRDASIAFYSALNAIQRKEWRAFLPPDGKPAEPAHLFVNNCAVIERTADGVPVGRCFLYLVDGVCSRHGKPIAGDTDTDLAIVARALGHKLPGDAP